MNRLVFVLSAVRIISGQTVANLDPQPAPTPATVTTVTVTKREANPIKRASVKGVVSASSIQVDVAGNTEYLQLACIDTDTTNTDGANALRDLVQGKLIEYSPVDRDTVEVGIEGTNVNLRLLQLGLAKLVVSEQCQQNKDYRAAAGEARAAKSGLYAERVPEPEFDITRFAPDRPVGPSFGKLLLGAALSGMAEGFVEAAYQRSFFGPSNDVLVRGYYRKGTYVAPHHRTRPDGIKANNYSTKGNTNPYTGKRGTK